MYREISILSEFSFRIIYNIIIITFYLYRRLFHSAMDTFRTLMRQEKQHEMVIFVLLILYIVFTPSVPHALAEYAESTMGQVIVVILAITLFLSTNPVVGILGFLAAYEFIRRSSRTTGVYGIETFSPTEKRKQAAMTAMNPAPEKTLEEELVESLVVIAPNDVNSGLSDGGSFQPVLGELYGAVEPEYDGVI